MPIHGKKIPIALNPAVPTELTPEKLQRQLNDIGLTCKYTSKYNLKKFIADVKHQIPDLPDALEVWGILNPSSPAIQEAGLTEAALASVFADEDNPTGNWTPQPTALGYATTLSYIGAHFAWLKKNRPTFTGKSESNKYSERYDSVDSIKKAFVHIAANMASVVATGLNRAAIEATFSDIISPMSDSDAKDYDKKSSNTLYLVDDFDPNTNSADGIGVLIVEWSLYIKDYKHKKEAMQYDTKMTVTAKAIQYDSLAAMQADYQAAKASFKTPDASAGAELLFGAIPARNTSVDIFKRRPPADEHTFQHSLPLLATADATEVIVLYAPNLNNIGSIDNSQSKATTTFSRAVSNGFSFSSTQSVKFGFEFEAGVVFAKAKFSMEFALSFTETSSKTTTETMTFTVPAGEKCFTYQGFLYAAVLTFDADSGTFSYSNEGRLLTQILATSEAPILNSNIEPPVKGSSLH